MEWIQLIISLLGLSFVRYFWKLIFSKKFRETLRRNDFKNSRDEADEFIKYIEELPKEIIQLQNATNYYLGTDKFHYSFIIPRFRNCWNFKNNIKDLIFSSTFIEQKIENNNAQLFYKYSIENLKRIEKYNVLFFVVIACVYVIAIFFEIVFIEWVRYKYSFDIDFYNYLKVVVLMVALFLMPITALFGSKATVALSLKNIFNIKEKVKIED